MGEAIDRRAGGTRGDADAALEVVEIVREILVDAVVGAYLHGSAVLGGLRPTSDIDVLVVIDRPTGLEERRAITDRLLGISGRRAYRGPARPIELTIVLGSDVRPWRYPPRVEYQYGEWLRDEYEAGRIPEPGPSPDLAPLVAMALQGNRALIGPPPAQLFDPVPAADLRRAIVAGVPDLLANLETDTRNVLLTLARIWATLETAELQAKDTAAAWASARLPGPIRPALDRARSMYVDGWDEDDWGAMRPEARVTADRLVDEIRRLVG